MWCIKGIDAEYEQRMMDVLEVYERPYDPKKPVICLDEKSVQLLAETREPIPARPGRVKRTDYEYERKGTVNLFVMVEPKGKRHRVTVTKRRANADFAKEMEKIVMDMYRDAEKVVLVTDNLNIHSPKAILETLGEARGRLIVDKIEWHYTPKHASWLDMAEIEINALSSQCLKQKIPAFQDMQKQTAAWTHDRNKKEIGITWQFTREKAREKFKLTSGVSMVN
ncbi:MAG: IS630 family transposase [Patescibacteria group bacterium]